jgi:uncharacterized membrane protein YozB (DUF420 family)
MAVSKERHVLKPTFSPEAEGAALCESLSGIFPCLLQSPIQARGGGMQEAFFNPNAPPAAILTLLLEISMVVGLTFGAWMARRRQYRLHALCQSLIVLLNLVVIAIEMLPSFQTTVRPKIPERLGHSYYGLATAHAVLGSVAEVAALYVILAAGTKILPERWRLANFKSRMRSLLAVWWLVLLFGVATYLRWYVPLR